MGDVIKLSEFRDATSEPDQTNFNVRVSRVQSTAKQDLEAETKTISLDKLYPLGAEKSPELKAAARLLGEAVTLTNDALEHQRGGDLLASEISMQQVKALLPELFCCRTIGDGFGASISALFHGIENHGSQGYDENQLISIRFMVQKLAEEPFLSFKDAEAIIDDLENIGFVIDLLEFEILAEALNVEGLS